jgi:glycosyltransferase involved in cell wall biosynthesis
MLGAVTRSRYVYINGIVTWPTTIALGLCRLLRRRELIVAPRGGLMPDYVEQLRASFRTKWLYYALVVRPLIRRHVLVHATSEVEAAGVRRFARGADVVVLPNGVQLPSPAELGDRTDPPGPGVPIRITYLGRVSPEKGVRPWLAHLTRFTAETSSRIEMDVVGPISTAYGRTVRDEFAGDSIRFLGVKDDAGVSAVLRESHWLVLPSGLSDQGDAMRENFGNVAAEALAHGVPVLACAGLSWDWIDAERCGFAFEPNGDGVRRVLSTVTNVRAVVWAEMSDRARRVAEERFSIADIASRLRQLLESLGR